MRQLAAGRIDTASAGTAPAGRVHPLTLQYLGEHGYDTAGLYSKHLDAVSPFRPDVAITVCDSAAGESCPVWLGNAIKAHWGLPDPSHPQGTSEAASILFANVIECIERRTQRLLDAPFESMATAQLAELLHDIGKQA